MKRFIAALSLAVFAGPALAVGSGLPNDQSLIDRALPDLQDRALAEFPAEAAAARVPSGAELATGPWAGDHHFIAPA